MEYLSSMERRAMERGRQAGIEVLAGEISTSDSGSAVRTLA